MVKPVPALEVTQNLVESKSVFDSSEKIALNKIKDYDFLSEGSREEEDEFKGIYLPTLNNKLSYIDSFQKVEKDIKINNNLWTGVPVLINSRTNIECTLGDNELIFLVIDNKPYSLKSPGSINISGLLSDIGVIIPKLSGSVQFVFNSKDGQPIKSISSTTQEEITVEDDLGNTNVFTNELTYSSKSKVVDKGTLANFDVIPRITELPSVPSVIRRGTKAFRLENATSDSFLEEVSTIFSDRVRDYIPGQINRENRFIFSDFVNDNGSIIVPPKNSIIATIRNISSELPLTIDIVYLQDSPLQVSSNDMPYRIINENDISVLVSASGLKNICYIQGNLNGTKLSKVCSIIIKNLLHTKSTSDGKELIIKNTILSSVIIESKWLDFSYIDSEQDEIIESSVEISNAVGPVPFSFVDGKIRTQKTIAEDAMPGTLFNHRVEIPVSVFQGDTAALFDGGFVLNKAIIYDTFGIEVLNLENMVVTLSATHINLYGILPEKTPPGEGTLSLEFSIKRRDPNVESDNYNELSTQAFTFSVSEIIESYMTYQIRRERIGEFIACDIFASEESFMLVNRELVKLLEAEERNFNLLSELITPDGSILNIITNDYITLLPGWNTIRVSKDLFMVPMEDRGELDPRNNFSIEKFDLGNIRIDKGRVFLSNPISEVTRQLWVKIEDNYFIVKEILQDSLVIDFDGGGENYNAELIIQTREYRRYSNRFYQDPEAGPLSKISGPIFYLSGQDIIPASSLTNFRDMSPDFSWGFVLGDLSEYRVSPTMISCPTGDEVIVEDSPNTMLLPVPLPKWERWLAHFKPMARVSGEDIRWNLPIDYEGAYSLDNELRIKFSWDYVGNLDIVDITSAETDGSWPVLYLPYSGPGAPFNGIVRDDIFYFSAINLERQTILGIGTVASATVVTSTEGFKRWKVLLITRHPPTEPGKAVRIRGRAPKIISHFRGLGPSPRVSCGYEFTYPINSPYSVKVTYPVSPSSVYPNTGVIAEVPKILIT